MAGARESKKETRATGDKMRCLITGCNGFVGFHLVHEILRRTDWDIVSLERLSNRTPSIDREGKVTGVLPTRAMPSNPRYTRVYHDFRAPLTDTILQDLGDVDYIIHNGAEVHAIRSLTDPRSFVESNAIGVFNLLEAARKLHVRNFIYTSSAEVLGAAPEGVSHSEDSPLNPSNPYSAAKAAGEMLCHSYFKSFRVPVMIARTMNLFGPTQDVTKFVPMAIKKGLNGETLKYHVRGLCQHPIFPEVGSRQWIHVSHYVDALLFLLEHGVAGEAYNIAGFEQSNLDIIEKLNFILPHTKQIKAEPIEAPATHDMRYNISDEKIRNLGWSGISFWAEHFKSTVNWYLEHPECL